MVSEHDRGLHCLGFAVLDQLEPSVYIVNFE